MLCYLLSFLGGGELLPLRLVGMVVVQEVVESSVRGTLEHALVQELEQGVAAHVILVVELLAVPAIDLVVLAWRQSVQVELPEAVASNREVGELFLRRLHVGGDMVGVVLFARLLAVFLGLGVVWMLVLSVLATCGLGPAVGALGLVALVTHHLHSKVI